MTGPAFLSPKFADSGRSRLFLWLLVLLALLGGAVGNCRAGQGLTNTYQVSRYELRGNTVLEPAAKENVLSGAVGPAVSLACICRSLAALRKAYQQRGYPAATVSLPEQELTNGVVVISICEGPAGIPPVIGSNPSLSATNHQPPTTFEVRQFEVVGNTLLPPEEIGRVLKSAVGPALTVENVRQAAASLQRAYRERGYATVAVSVPAQRLTNATVRLRVTEGNLVAVEVLGNYHFSSNNIVRALPSLKTNSPLNSLVLQRELDLANENRDRQIYPTLGPGPDPGTSALVLRVKDRVPLHAHVDMDDYSTPGTPDLRVNAAVQYDNLWDHEQQAGLAYSFTPQELKSKGNTPNYGFNQPLISSYSAFYRIPLPGSDTLGDQIASSSRFGYQEATRQFRLPPAQTASELNFYASASDNDTGTKWSAPQVVSQSSLLSIISKDSGRNLVGNQNLGGQYRFPLLTADQASLRGFLGIEYKRATTIAYNTNNFFVTAVTTNLYGGETNQTVNSTNQPATNQVVAYFPLNGGLDYSETDPEGSTAINLELAGNFTGQDAGFARQAYSAGARAVFGKATVLASRDQKLPGGCSVLVRANGQAATGALVNSEQFALGGINNVRGYYEGDEYGDDGWSGSLELRTPWFQTPVASLSQSVPAWLRASVFTDGGQCFLLQPSPDAADTRWLWGAGFGLAANVNNHLDARVAIAWPLVNSANTTRGETRVYFTIGGQF